MWGVPCREISAEWGAQRIKKLSITKALANASASPFRSSADHLQKRTETSLIERFMYPKLGPGQMWEEVAHRIALRGGNIYFRHRIIGIERERARSPLSRCWTRRRAARDVWTVISRLDMPVSDLIAMLDPEDPR